MQTFRTMMSDFAAERHRPENAFAHFTEPVERLLEYTDKRLNAGAFETGYRKEVRLVTIQAHMLELFRVGYVRLTPEFVANHSEVIENLRVEFARRVGGHPEEDKFLHIVSRCAKPIAGSGIIVVYDDQVLLEEKPDPIVTPPPFNGQIISINCAVAGQTDLEVLPLEALYRNEMGLVGGTLPEKPVPASEWKAAAGRHLTCVNICEPIDL
jgi:hypothetical protein